MSRRTATTLYLQVKLRMPPGANIAMVLAFIREAIKFFRLRVAQESPEPTDLAIMSDLQVNEMIVKLEKKETVYL